MKYLLINIGPRFRLFIYKTYNEIPTYKHGLILEYLFPKQDNELSTYKH